MFRHAGGYDLDGPARPRTVIDYGSPVIIRLWSDNLKEIRPKFEFIQKDTNFLKCHETFITKKNITEFPSQGAQDIFIKLAWFSDGARSLALKRNLAFC